MPLSYSIGSLFSGGNSNDPAKRKLLEPDLEAQRYHSTMLIDQFKILNSKIPLDTVDTHSSKMNFTPNVADDQIQSQNNVSLVTSMGSISDFGEDGALSNSAISQPSSLHRVNTAQSNRRLNTGSAVAVTTLFGVGIVTVAVILFRNYKYIFGSDSASMPAKERYIGFAAIGMIILAIAAAGFNPPVKNNSNSNPDEENNSNLNLDEARNLCAAR